MEMYGLAVLSSSKQVCITCSPPLSRSKYRPRFEKMCDNTPGSFPCALRLECSCVQRPVDDRRFNRILDNLLVVWWHLILDVPKECDFHFRRVLAAQDI